MKEREKMMDRIQKTTRLALKNNFLYFLQKGFEELNPGVKYQHNWHIDELCNNLIDIYMGNTKRLSVSMPPRYLKSLCISVCFPAWVLGINPKKRIIVASYSSLIANKLSSDTKKLMESLWYQELFPDVQFAKGQNRKNRFETTQKGFRLAVSSGGTLTGEGADFLIVDDPHKPITIKSEKQRQNVINWFEGTFISRLNNKKSGSVIVVMQRLHKEDLVGYLEKNHADMWKFINFQAIREDGTVLHKEREDMADLISIKKQMGENEFEAQYQQMPRDLTKGLIEKEAIELIDHIPDKEDVLTLSIDSASKAGKENDFTAVTVWKVKENEAILVDAFKFKLEFRDMVNAVKDVINRFHPKFVLIEDKSSGIQLIQEMKSFENIKVIAIKPQKEKIIRFSPTIVYLEQKFIKINKNIKILNDLLQEVLSFPNSKHDDFIDSISQFVQWREKIFGSFTFDKKMVPAIKRLVC